MTDDDKEVREATFDLPADIAYLVAAIHKPLADYYRAGPPTHQRAYDAMSALAIVAATIIVGCEAEMYKWFGEAIYEAVNRMADTIEAGRNQDNEPKQTMQ